VAVKLGKSVSARKIARIEPLEDRRLLSASLSVANSMMVFNAVKNSSASPTETLTLTDTGDAPINFGSISLTNDSASPTQDAARFTVLNSVPASLAPGQSFNLQLNYKAIATGINSAFLNIASDDPANPSQQVALRGIGTAGLGGTNQPSLTRILRAYEIPTLVGEADNATLYPNPPGADSQEVALQRLVKAGAGPVTIQVLASFTANGTKPYTLGTYPAGNPSVKNELFFTPTAESQSTYIHPQGATSFDPGSSAFGFYFVSNNPVKGRIGTSEDAFNTWDTTNSRKVRFFPLENPDGSVVPNAYIMTTTEWPDPSGYDFTNIVAIVRNVKAAPGSPSGPVMGLQNLNPLPGSDRMIFNRIQTPNTTIGDQVHDTGILQINNTGNQALVINSFSLSSSAWKLLDGQTLGPVSFPITVPANSSYKLAVKFVATTEPSHPYNETSSAAHPNDGGVYTGTLTLNSNDPNAPSQSIPLAGWWQRVSENANEPSLQSLVNLLAGWNTNINATPIPELTESMASGSTPTYYGEETVSAYWALADASQSVNIQQLDSYHTEGNTAALSWFTQGNKTLKNLIKTASDYGQTLFPFQGTAPAAASFSPGSVKFGFNLDGEWSDDSFNTAVPTGGGHHVRFYPVRDSQGALVPNTYIMTMDYSDPVSQNFDFQDNIYLVSNIHPATTPPAPTDVYATASTHGGVALQWAPVQDASLQGYNVYRSLSSNSGFALLSAALVTNANYLDGTALAGTTYYYRVTAVDSSAESLGAQASAVGTASSSAPPTPANFIATGIQGGISLQWSAVSGSTLKGYNVYSSSTLNGQYTLLTSSPITQTTFTDTNAPAGVTTFYEVTAVDAATGLQSGPAMANGVAQQTAPIGSPQSADIGASPSGSTTVVTPGTDFDVVAGGPGVTNNSDGFRYIYQQQTGNFDVKVQVQSLTVAGNFSTAGILARATLDPASPDVYMSASPVNYRFKDRPSAGANTAIITSGSTSYPNVWVRLRRVGNTFTGYNSTDGVHWTKVSSVTLNLGSTVYLGLAVASNVTTTTTTAQLRGYSQTAGVGSVSGTVYNDINGDGSFNGGDQALSGWTVFLDTNNNGIFDAGADPTAVSGSNGNYSFTNLSPGTYHVLVSTPDGWRQTQPFSGSYTIGLAAGQNTISENFGAQQQQTASISGTVFLDANGNGVVDSNEAGLAGWGVFIDANNNGAFDAGTDTRVFADANGHYTFTGLAAGQYHLVENASADWTRTVPLGNSYTVTLATGQSVTDKNFGANQTAGISGTVFQDLNGNGVLDPGEPALVGWGVFLDFNNNGVFDPSTDQRVFSDANGNFSITGLTAGHYRLAENTPGGWSRTVPVGSSYSINLTAGQSLANQNFGVSQGSSLTGNIFTDYNGDGVRQTDEPPLQFWGVFLDNNNNGFFDSGDVRVFADANGNYTFPNLAPGNYHLMQGAVTGWTRTTPASLPDNVTISAGQITTVNFGENEAVISGTVFRDVNNTGTKDVGDPGLSGWGVFIDNNANAVFDAGIDIRVFSDANGNYRFVGLAPGTYNINESVPTGFTRTTPTLAGYTITLTAGQIVTGKNIGNFSSTVPLSEIATMPRTSAFATSDRLITESNYASLVSAGLFDLKRDQN
jgi:protocatechuate 3,4-dioxygenase beta subunit